MKTETSGDINALLSGSNIGRNWTKCICPNINFQRGNMEGLSMWARLFMRMDEKSKKREANVSAKFNFHRKK